MALKKITPKALALSIAKAMKKKKLTVFNDDPPKWSANVTLNGFYTPIVSMLTDKERAEMLKSPENSFLFGYFCKYSKFFTGPDTNEEKVLIRKVLMEYDSLVAAVRNHGKVELTKKRKSAAMGNFVVALKACMK